MQDNVEKVSGAARAIPRLRIPCPLQSYNHNHWDGDQDQEAEHSTAFRRDPTDSHEPKAEGFVAGQAKTREAKAAGGWAGREESAVLSHLEPPPFLWVAFLCFPSHPPFKVSVGH